MHSHTKTSETSRLALAKLNPEQQKAVTAPFGNILVLAGAGSGKTRVLVHRIAYLIEDKHVSPANILAVTFTNKAAHEMRARLERMLERSYALQQMWVGTFHGLAHRLLRRHWQEANLPQHFQILDGDDQLRIIKRVHKALNLSDEKWPYRETQWFINNNKDSGLRPHDLASGDNAHSAMQIRIYQLYEETCQNNGLVDFAELLLRSYELLQKNPGILSSYQERFQHILVDEFQDTNSIQYAWIKILAQQQSNIMAVGDDDQSIYSWRGAKIENLLRFGKEHKAVNVIRLEQNYRSTGNILSAANAVILNNSIRMGKNLWTDSGSGETIKRYAAFNEVDEAQFIVDSLRVFANEGNQYKDIAILYRSNAQSRILEECLLQVQIPYRIYGGLRFFERAEIKDAMAYLRLIANRQDSEAFERVVNTPTRGIGNTTLQVIRDFANQNSISMWESAHILIAEKKLTSRANGALMSFLMLIENLAKQNLEKSLHELITNILHVTGLRLHFAKDTNQRGEAKLENLDELITAAERFAGLDNGPDEDLPLLNAFLAHAALEAGEMQANEFDDCVQLMTLHAAKGLEFPLVFLSGMEEGLFPHQMSMNDPKGLEEERRLCYVGITRAMKKLYITHASMRRLHGSDNYHRPSRFIKEIPENLIAEVRTH